MSLLTLCTKETLGLGIRTEDSNRSDSSILTGAKMMSDQLDNVKMSRFLGDLLPPGDLIPCTVGVQEEIVTLNENAEDTVEATTELLQQEVERWKEHSKFAESRT